jgi:cytochrome P450
MSGEIIHYPMFQDPALTVNERYKEIQAKGLIKVKLPYGEPAWLATRYHDVRQVFGDHRLSRKMSLDRDAPGLFPSARMNDPGLLLNQDPPGHTGTRRLVAAPFTPGHVQELTGKVQQIVDELADDLAAAGPPADFVSIFSAQLSFRVLSGILGIPRDKGVEFRKWIEIAANMEGDEETKAEANAHSYAFIKGMLADKRVRPADDLLSILVQARDRDDKLTEDQLVSLAFQFWFGGFKTVFWQLGNTVYTLMTHREHWQELLDNPGLMTVAMEELGRWIPSFRYAGIFPRFAKEDVEFSDGTVMRAGESIVPEIAVANRDESVYPHAGELDFHRVEPPQHLAFTHGAHKCIGQHLARLQIRLAIETLLRRFPTLSLAVAPEELTWSSSTLLRSVETLPLTW